MDDPVKKIVHYEINGKRYDRVEDIPPEFRKLVQAMNEDPKAFNAAKVTTVTTQDLLPGAGGRPAGDHREKFLRETVLPNLHRLDPKAQAEVLKAISGEASGKQDAFPRTLFRIIGYVMLGFLLLLIYRVLKGLFSLP